jgi:hypothetical protein
MKASAAVLRQPVWQDQIALQTYHQVQVNVVYAKALQGALNTFLNALVPWVVELGGNPDLLTWYTRIFDALADFFFVAIGKSSVDVAVASLECSFDSFANLARFRLPCPEANRWDLCAGVELVFVRDCTPAIRCGIASNTRWTKVVHTVKLSCVQFLGDILARVRSIKIEWYRLRKRLEIGNGGRKSLAGAQ